MENREHILSELKEIAPRFSLAGITRTPYVVPAGYFDDFASIMMTRIRLETAGFSESSVREIAEISPLLAGLQHKNPYQTPSGFFENLDIKIPATINEPGKLIAIPSPESGKQSPVKRISWLTRVGQFAAAASVAALIGIAVFNTGNHQNTIDPIEGLTNVSDQDMANFMDSDDIHWTPGIISSPSETASIDFSDNDIHELLSSVPDAELEQYADALPAEKRSVN